MDIRAGRCAIRVSLIASLLLLAADAAALQAAETPPVPSDEQLEAAGAVIGEVAISSGDVFDPEDPQEDRRLFRLANRLHRTTRESVIAGQLLFRPGDRYSRRVL